MSTLKEELDRSLASLGSSAPPEPPLEQLTPTCSNIRSRDLNWEVSDAVLEGAIHNMWASYGGMIRPCSEAVRALTPGMYLPGIDDGGNPYLILKHTVTDKLIELPDGAGEEVIAEITQFWASKDKYRRASQLWKRGVLLYGPPGCGKTGVVNIVTQKVIELGGVVIMVSNPRVATICLDMIRAFEPDRPIVCIYEEVETIVRNYDEQDLLVMLDGENQVDNVLHIATTNYLSKLPPRIRARPGRFDLVKEVPLPGVETRRAYIEFFMEPFITGEDAIAYPLEEVLSITENMSTADIKELLLSTYILELAPLEERAMYIKEMHNLGEDD